MTGRLRRGPGPVWAIECPPWDPQEDADRCAAWRAGLLRRAYDTGWLPPSVVRNIRWIDVNPSVGTVTLTLVTGAKLIDTGERVELHGRADDIGVREVLAAADRRGWGAIEVTGSDDFRRQVTVAAALRNPPIVVTNVKLSPVDQAAVDRILAHRGQGGTAFLSQADPPVEYRRR